MTRSGQYWAFAHYSRHIQRGAKVLSAGASEKPSDAKSLSHAAFRNPDGGFVLVVANPGPEKTVCVQSAGNCLDFKVPADSVHTLEWS